MSHTDAGNYAAKRTKKSEINLGVAKRVRVAAKGGTISCADAHALGHELGVPPAIIGEAIDADEVKITHCQLGLFGHVKGRRNIVAPAQEIPEQLINRIEADTRNGRISCADLWTIADDLDLPKTDMTAACDFLELKISTCQLGTF